MTAGVEGFPYASPAALEAALNSRFKQAAAAGPYTAGQLRRQFAYNRLLGRLMLPAADGTAGRWMIKGGVSLLARLSHARHTTDVDLRGDQATAEAAVAAFLEDAATPLGDFFSFRFERSAALTGVASGTQLSVEAVLGRKTFERFSVDIVVGPSPVGEPELVSPFSPVSVPGLSDVPYRLYPLADTLADKTLAIVQRYGSDTASTRYRDLVDIVLIARERSVDLQELSTAIALQRMRRGVDAFDSFVVPDGRWAEGYRRTAADVAGLEGYRDLASAERLAKQLLDPVLGRELLAGRWDPAGMQWEPLNVADSPNDDRGLKDRSHEVDREAYFDSGDVDF